MFINYGKDNANARDEGVYILGMDRDASGFYDEFTLARAPDISIKDVASHDYFNGLNANDSALWTSSFSLRQPIHTNPDSIHWGATINYNPVLNRVSAVLLSR